jgi:hypothetical protein
MIFIEKYIDKKTLKKIKYILNRHKISFIKSDKIATKNGKQSNNIVSFFNEDIYKKILPFNFYEKVFHVHYIKYDVSGTQVKHDHSKTEKYSFILYLDNGSGNTVFEFNTFKYSIKPSKGKILIFSSDIFHKGEEVKDKKEILVGAIDRV